MATQDQGGEFYGEGARALQDTFDSRRLADTLAAVTVHHELTDDDIELIREQSTVWISTVDADGWPDISYKGGDVGFVEVVTPGELRIPIYDGNGMWRTLGNITDDGRVALLFVDTARPWRMRVHGQATVSLDARDVDRHVGAQAVVIVTIGRIFPNCGRYIHQDGEISTFVPRVDHTPPIPDWKRIDGLREVLPARDQKALAADENENENEGG
jgi:predicted pyridoxine 5'-phosphate oxidase superfamily flavin-nucleotide-binding protein